jgi:UDP-GlcNAc:undecaprenyl-phosphate/decaprenyl-phosphate GlcNAc-1-phosphate transferase
LKSEFVDIALMFDLFIAFIASILISTLLTKYVRDLARAKGWFDRPDSVRHLHGRPVPRLGGVAIIVTLIVNVAATLLWERGGHAEFAFSLARMSPLFVPATLIFLVGLYDDFRPLKPYGKFGTQLAAACLLYFNGIGIHHFHLVFRRGHWGTFSDLFLTIIWVLLVTNAFNLIDGLDGLAAGAALTSTSVVFVLSLYAGNALITLETAVLAGATIGFLRFNFPQATVFLGDSGSLLIGFLLSALALECPPKATTMVAVAIPVVCFGLPILDVSISLARRFLNGRPLFQADNEHIHHMLLKRGLCPRNAVLILYGVSAFCGLVSLMLVRGGVAAALVLAVAGIALFVGIPQLRYQEFKEVCRLGDRTANQKRIIANDLRIRHAVEAFESCENPADLFRILSGALPPNDFDGFSLSSPLPIRLPFSLPPGIEQNHPGELTHFWRPRCSHSANWELKIELVDKDGTQCGSFALYRQLTNRPLMLDINLLSDGFQVGLAQTVRRLLLDRRPEESGYELPWPLSVREPFPRESSPHVFQPLSNRLSPIRRDRVR